MRHIVPFRDLWAWIGSWLFLDIVWAIMNPGLPSWAQVSDPAAWITRDLHTAWFILGVWVFCRETAAIPPAHRGDAAE